MNASHVALAAIVLLCACHSGPKDQLLAEAVIGPDGGTIAVTDGALAGLLLSVPPGALDHDVTLRAVRPAPPSLPPGMEPAVVLAPGTPVRLEPVTQEFLAAVELTLPYRPQAILTTAPGNVRARHTRAEGIVDLMPLRVDVPGGRLAVGISVLGLFEVVCGPHVARFDDYLPASGSSVPLEDGFQFAYDEVTDAHFAGGPIARWRIGSAADDTALYVQSFEQRGRSSIRDDWQEVWRTPMIMLRHESVPPAPTPPTVTDVYSPITAASPTGHGSALMLGAFRFPEPMQVGSRLVLDVLELHLVATWERSDIGTGRSDQVFWFSPGLGLLGLQQDGVTHLRTDL